MSHDLYRDRDARLDTVVGDGKAYWTMLSRIMIDQQNRDMLWQDWCEAELGFRLVYDDDGNITTERQESIYSCLFFPVLKENSAQNSKRGT